jgi:hypothetical protein
MALEKVSAELRLSAKVDRRHSSQTSNLTADRLQRGIKVEIIHRQAPP